MIKILIYGDSNVWGDNFLTGERIADNKQWPNILKNNLGKNYTIFQEGLPGRLAGNEEISKLYKNGQDTFLATFRTNAPVNQVIIMLGTNDLQIKYKKSSSKIIEDLLWYKKTIENEFADLENRKKYFVNEQLPKIIYILPINFDYEKNAKEIFNQDSETKRQEIINYFKKENIDCIIPNDISIFEDGIHLDYKGHEKLANIVGGFLEK